MSIKFVELKKFDYYCKDVQELLLLYVVWPEEITFDERDETTKHLHKCPKCKNNYLKLKPIAQAIRENPQCLVEHGILKPNQEHSSGLEPTHKEIMQMRFESKLERAILRRRRREQRERVARIKKMLKPISAVAACLVAAIGVYLTVIQLTCSENASVPTVAIQSPKGSVKIELLTGSGPEIISVGQPIIAASEIKTLRINDNRQMVLNAGTQLSIVPHNLGCIVRLDKGEIYTEVEHDGKPFTVETIHGRAIITGTTFNIKTDNKQMELAVAEGTVSFEGKKGSVNVTAGHRSLLTSNTKPTLPVLCDTGKLIAWVKGIDEPQEIAATAFFHPELDLYSMFDSEQIDLEGIDYDSWIEQKRDWFKREFTHVFRFKMALAKEGIKTDYPELLIKSGDLWRFEYPAKSNTQLVSVSDKSLLNLAAVYGKDKQWLMSSVGAIGSFNPTAKTNLDALDKWASAVNTYTQQPNSGLTLYSLYASVYLIETRTLLWLAVKNDMTAVKLSGKAEFLSLLEKEVEVASRCATQNKRLFVEAHKVNTCDDSGCWELLQGVAGNIEEITEIESAYRRVMQIKRQLLENINVTIEREVVPIKI